MRSFCLAILAAMIAYVSVGVGMATLRRVDPKYLSVVLLGFVLPGGAVVSAAMNSALPALQLSAANPAVQAALNRSIYWSSIQGLGNGFLFLVLVVPQCLLKQSTGTSDGPRCGACWPPYFPGSD